MLTPPPQHQPSTKDDRIDFPTVIDDVVYSVVDNIGDGMYEAMHSPKRARKVILAAGVITGVALLLTVATIAKRARS